MPIPYSLLAFILAACSVALGQRHSATPVLQAASPESQGLDSAVLAEALDFVRDKHISLHSFLIVRNGMLILEAYIWPYQGWELHDVASVTKSFTSAAIGIAIDKRLLKGVDERVVSILPAAEPDSTGKRERLTIENLLTMTSGLECDTEGGEKALAAMRRSSDWAAFALALPMRAEPGTRYAYCSCNNHLLSSLVTARAGESLASFAEKSLFRSIGIKEFIWPADPRGRTHGWGDLHLRPRDMAKFGLLFLNRGKWNNQQVISEKWVQESASAKAKVKDGVAYGYGWWVNTARPPIFEAVGRGGQRISVLPKENIVVVFNGGGADTDQVAPFLLRAIRSDTAIPENPDSRKWLERALRRVAAPVSEERNMKNPPIMRRVSGVAFALESNPLELRSIKLDFRSKSEANATLKFAQGEWSAPVGLDGQRRLRPVGPYGLNVGAVGRWVSDSEFLLDLDTISNVNHFVFNVRFYGDKAQVRMNETTGEMKDVIVNGTALRSRSN